MNNQIPVTQIDPENEPPTPGHGAAKAQPVELYASREKIYVRNVEGFYQHIRRYSLWGLMGMYFLFCWITINGEPLLYFNLPAREFHLFGGVFYPQEFILLTGFLIIAAFGLFFITTLFGRVWCGYTCPQTVWTFVFMWIEERVEGSRNQRMKLDKAPPSAAKIGKKSLKHALWLLVGLATGITFVGYFYPIRDLLVDLATLEAGGWAYFWVFFFTLATYGNAGWMREQVCLYMCPYARFQSVMFDRNTMMVTYDPARGEPRGSRKKQSDPRELGLGDCIDCDMCVQVCPTGIDIRDGLQYECISCALCIDACDDVMKKMNYPTGLIRYATENELEGRPSKFLRFRTVGYGAALLLMIAAVAFTIVNRSPIDVEVSRDRGGLYRMTGQGLVENSYTVKLMNKSLEERTFELTVGGLEGAELVTNGRVTVAPGENRAVPTVVTAPPESLDESRENIVFTISSDGDDPVRVESNSSFIGPVN
ncbi:cytochrome c oxidase accessory protein CcoG [Hydrocarboniclastica marina]|uniref:Cytochrome c oxidase accessory protein CcoG n=1 Tax=Hydrocarboniclastica marina TaxID=2259620 RepID=A0A4P7XG84_9ALTE|nr:cytochrome c oxidase accessory protein CcoG [Hydrocarboniclastica marina]MAL98620.1 cytochrome c oxidase accessory protein CcoG [Alteromonadaceae bacterium]QCF25633.1 cytochrome c oxidase accessory protein CcoG [Hydrocarboniclastica marina]|tara:strand:+ start:1823 stop:3262 length:1440 start_codon:yes stop_codon:yes gene_type:complete